MPGYISAGLPHQSWSHTMVMGLVQSRTLRLENKSHLSCSTSAPPQSKEIPEFSAAGPRRAHTPSCPCAAQQVGALWPATLLVPQALSWGHWAATRVKEVREWHGLICKNKTKTLQLKWGVWDLKEKKTQKTITVELARGAQDRTVIAEIERSGHNQEVHLGEE